MEPNINYNKLDLHQFLLPACYLTITLSTMAFTLLFFLNYYVILPQIILPYFTHIKPYTFLHFKVCNIFLSMIHGMVIISSCIAFEHVFVFSLTQSMIDTSTTQTDIAIASISVGYLMYDTIICCIICSKMHTDKLNLIYVFHHVIAFLGVLVCVFQVYGGRPVIIGVFINEITNPILHINNMKNKLLSRDNLKKQSVKIFMDLMMKILYIILFSICRFVWMAHILFQVTFIFKSSIYFKIVSVLLVILSAALLPEMIKDANKTYSKYKTMDTSQNILKIESVQMTDDEINITKITEYNEILTVSKQSVKQLFVAGVVYSFFHANRMAIYVLYAQEFNPTMQQIAFLLYAANFWNGIASLLYASLANQYGYDIVLMLLLLLQCIAVLLESIATTFYVLFIGIILSQVAITYIVFAYIAWMLPHKYSALYTSYFYASFMVSYLVGPITAGLVSFYVSNRTVFIVNFALCAIALIHSFYGIRGSQKKVELLQLSVQLIEEKGDDEQFPICLEKLKHATEQQNKWYILPTMSCYEWSILLSMLYISSTVTIGETVFIIYYTVYIMADLDGNVIRGTCGIVVLSAAFIIGNLVVPKWFSSQVSARWQFLKNRYVVLALCISFMIFHLLYLYPHLPSLKLYWIFDISIGSTLGVISMTSEMIILDIQSTKDSGKVSGAKGLFRNWLKAFALLFVSLFWENMHNSMYYVVGICFVAALFVTLCAGYVTCKYKPQNNLQME